ncbi:hypothetical protein GA0070623_0198 [Micromonospora rifamycinica]|uniref:Extracellular repeat, HAF family n=2 Tax=Micromonospora rifamycinica TaxID=291594 RepID=A0A1C5GRI8_9ACTN|nr:hypothetical protein GA0070623_0198 [Micromonospora rifamycinica]
MSRSIESRVGGALTALGMSAVVLIAAAPATASAEAAAASPATVVRGQPGSACTVRPLAYPPDVYRADAEAIDPTGRFIAGTALRVEDTGNQELLLFWDRDRLTTLESPLLSSVADVNSSGVVVGNGWIDAQGRPWTYRDGVFTPLPVPPSRSAGATAINEAGDIIGVAEETATGNRRPLRWPAARPGTVETLDVPRTDPLPVAITQDGTIVGNGGDFARETAWVRRPDGRVADLTVPDARSTLVDSAAGHWAVGRAYLDGGYGINVRWDLRDRSWSRLADALELVTDVNAHGVVVGGDRIARGGTSRVLPGGTGGRAIADTGVVVGFRNDGRVIPMRWTGC